MTILEIGYYLDSHWLATIFESVFAIFIFLLGIPLLFAHVFMPEELRELYNKRFKGVHVKKIRGFVIWVLFFIVFFANHLIKNVIEHDCKTCIIPIWLLVLNLTTLIAFVLYFFHVLSYLKEVFLNKASYIVTLLNSIKKEIDETKKITPQLIDDLQTVCGGTKNPNARQTFLDDINTITNNYLSLADMDDSILEELIYRVLDEAAMDNISFHNVRDMKVICTINTNIIIKNNASLNPFNNRASIDCLSKIGNWCVKHNKNELLITCISTMYQAKHSYFQIKELCLIALQSGNPTPAAIKATKYLKSYFHSNDAFEKEAWLKNSITFFSWLFIDSNEQMRKFISEKLSSAIGSKKITKADFVKVLDSYYDSYDFFTANAVEKLTDFLYPNSKKNKKSKLV